MVVPCLDEGSTPSNSTKIKTKIILPPFVYLSLFFDKISYKYKRKRGYFWYPLFNIMNELFIPHHFLQSSVE